MTGKGDRTHKATEYDKTRGNVALARLGNALGVKLDANEPDPRGRLQAMSAPGTFCSNGRPMQPNGRGRGQGFDPYRHKSDNLIEALTYGIETALHETLPVYIRPEVLVQHRDDSLPLGTVQILIRVGSRPPGEKAPALPEPVRDLPEGDA